MVKQKGYRYRLKPTTKQRQNLNQAFGCARKLYNFYVDDLYRQLEARGYESGRIDNVSVRLFVHHQQPERHRQAVQ